MASPNEKKRYFSLIAISYALPSKDSLNVTKGALDCGVVQKAATNMSRVLPGKWKLVMSASVMANWYGGYIKIEVELAPGMSIGLDSRARMVVVPMDKSFLPDFFSAAILFDVVGEIV